MPKTLDETLRELDDRSRRFWERVENEPGFRRRMMLATRAFTENPATGELELKPELRTGRPAPEEPAAPATGAAA